MTWDEVQQHVPAIKGHFEKLAKRFPTDLTVQSLLDHVLAGRRDLWLILDGDTLLATAMSAVETLDATGIRVLRLMDLGGGGVHLWADELLREMEIYGDQHQVDFLAVEGRFGWAKVIEPMGFKKHAVLWRKPSKSKAEMV